MEVTYRRCAGLDVHKKSITVCVRLLNDAGTLTKRVREFGTTTHELRNLRQWLASQQVTHVAMESTGVYWKPVWNVLEEGAFELLLCNARDIKQVPGRKTDVKDCEWIARLLQHGLLRGSFVPTRALRDLRDLTRARAKYIDEKTASANRLHKVLEDANVKLASVASDALGASGRAMIRAIIAGVTDPAILADLAKRSLRGKIPALRFALDGHVTDHHRFMLNLLLRQVENLEALIATLDLRIAETTGQLNAESQGEQREQVEGPGDPPSGDTLPLFPRPDGEPPPDSPGGARPPANAAESSSGSDTEDGGAPPLARLAVAVELLCSVPGIQTRTAENILAETGDDMTRFPSAGHFASWAGMSPGNNTSAGKSKSGKTTKGNRFLRRALTQAAWAASRTKDTYYSAQYRRLASRRGKKRAIVAVAHSLLTAIYHMLERGVAYDELGADYFDRLNAQGLANYHLKRLKDLGYEVSLDEAA